MAESIDDILKLAKQMQVDAVPVKRIAEANWNDAVMDCDIPVVVDVYTDWCGPCKMFAPTLEKVAREYAGQVKFLKLNGEYSKTVAGSYKVDSYPTLLYFMGGQLVGRSTGLLAEEQLREAILTMIENVTKPQ